MTYSLTQQMYDKKPCIQCQSVTFIFADQRCAVCTDAADWSKGAQAYIADLQLTDQHMKSCSKCGRWKGRDLFYPDKTQKNGLRSHCKKCVADSKNMRRQGLL